MTDLHSTPDGVSETDVDVQLARLQERFGDDVLRRLAGLHYFQTHGEYIPQLARLALKLSVACVSLRTERDALRRRVPSDEGGPGKEETYWLRIKLDAAIMHLRDIEDYYRLTNSLPASMNELRANRARQLWEAISEDLLNGKTTRPSYGDLEAEAAALRTERDAAIDREEATAAKLTSAGEAFREAAALRSRVAELERDNALRATDQQNLAAQVEALEAELWNLARARR